MKNRFECLQGKQTKLTFIHLNPVILMQSFLLSVGEKLVPLLKESKFKETGLLTPEEVININIS